jgi:hypothetical protein
MITPTANSKVRPTGARFPDYPSLPDSLKGNKAMLDWHASQSRMWDDFRLCLDRVGLGSDRGSSAYSSLLSTGSSNALLTFFGYGNGSLDGGGTIRTPSLTIATRTPTDATVTRNRGQKIFYQPNEPLADQDPQENDLWFDTDDNFRLYEYHGGKWVDVFSVVPSLKGVFDIDVLGRTNALLLAANARAEGLIDTKVAAVKEEILSSQTISGSIANSFKVVNAAIGDAYARITEERDA